MTFLNRILRLRTTTSTSAPTRPATEKQPDAYAVLYAVRSLCRDDPTTENFRLLRSAEAAARAIYVKVQPSLNKPLTRTEQIEAHRRLLPNPHEHARPFGSIYVTHGSRKTGDGTGWTAIGFYRKVSELSDKEKFRLLRTQPTRIANPAGRTFTSRRPAASHQPRRLKGKAREKALFACAERDGAMRCVWCDSADNLHLDHAVPISRGGTNEISNLRILCRTCNLKKNNKMDHELGRLA